MRNSARRNLAIRLVPNRTRHIREVLPARNDLHHHHSINTKQCSTPGAYSAYHTNYSWSTHTFIPIHSDPFQQPQSFSFTKAGLNEDDEDYEMINLGAPLDPLGAPKTKNNLSKDWIFPLPLALEDLFFGAHHRYRITRTLRNGRTQSVHLTLEIPPGWRKNTRLRVPGVGNQRKDGTFQDIVFVVEEQMHPRFVRSEDGRDIEVCVRVPWADPHRHYTHAHAHPHAHPAASPRMYTYYPPPSSEDEKMWEQGGEDEEMVYVKGIDGQEYTLAIPRTLIEGADGTRIIGAGMPIRKGGKVVGKGDLVVK